MRRVAMDYVDLVHITRHLSWKQFLEWKQDNGKRLVLLTTRGTQSFTDFSFQADDILLLGRESSGVPDEVREAADASVNIPVGAGARSLNLVQAASMALGESLRQTNGFPKAI
jgi:tRNA (cytidine/uridine-2'-O-)-methyltransferase